MEDVAKLGEGVGFDLFEHLELLFGDKGEFLIRLLG